MIGIYFASNYGQTAQIAHFLGEWFTEHGADVHVADLSQGTQGLVEVRNFDAVLVGAPMYRGRYPNVVRRFVKENRNELMTVGSTGFFSVCLAETPGTQAAHLESLRPVREFLDDVSWTPEWIASFPGALNYREYNPLLRRIMRGISEKNGGPTDTTKDFEFTRWDEVERFAQDFHDGAAQSPFDGELVPLATRTLNKLAPEFEQRIVQRIAIEATPDEVRDALECLESADMPLAEFLASIRNLGREVEKPASFREAAMAFGALEIETRQPHELLGALTGRFWARDYGIHRMRSVEELQAFENPAYTRAFTNFWFDEFKDGRTLVRTETRIHSLGPDARENFAMYWGTVSLGVRLYMKSILRGIRRSAARRRWQHRAIVA
ncbi:MAG: flavodoxin domain-containing protein [Candidatus Acidiferrales bacterium]